MEQVPAHRELTALPTDRCALATPGHLPGARGPGPRRAVAGGGRL